MTPAEIAAQVAAMPRIDAEHWLFERLEDGADMDLMHRIWVQAEALRDNARRRAA